MINKSQVKIFTGETMKKDLSIRCSFCNATLEDAKKMIRGEKANICDDCLNKGYKLLKKEKPVHIKVLSPKDIYNKLSEQVIGQDEVKKILSVSVYNHLLKINNRKEMSIDKSNILLLGETGSGKTFIVKELAKILDLPLAITDATSLTEAGYVGDDVENILLSLYEAANNDLELAERGIIYIDEIDKIAKRGNNLSVTRDVSGEGVQQALLKIIEGTTALFPASGGRKYPFQGNIKINTENILFIVGGAFSGLDKIITERLKYETNNTLDFVTEEDLIRFGMIPEFVGRIPLKGILKPIGYKELLEIMNNSHNAFINQYKNIFLGLGVKLEISDEVKEYIASKCVELKLGARGIKVFLDKIFIEIEFNLDYNKLPKEIIVSKDLIKDFLIENDILRSSKIKNMCIS